MLNELCTNGFAEIFELTATDNPDGLHVNVLGVIYSVIGPLVMISNGINSTDTFAPPTFTILLFVFRPSDVCRHRRTTLEG